MQKGMTFEYALSKLDEIAEKLENGEETLDSSIKLYQKGRELVKYCEEFLNEAEQKVVVLNQEGID